MAMHGYGFDPNMPPELAAESQRIAKQQAIAEAMLQRNMAPLPTNQGPLHWTQALAQVVNARQGRVDMDAATKARSDLGQKYQEGLAGEVERIVALRRGTPTTENIVDEQANDGEGAPAQIVTPARPNNRAAVEAAMLSQYAPVRQMGTAEFQHQIKADDPYTLAEGAMRVGPDGRVIRENPKDFRQPVEKAFKAGDIRKFLQGGQEVTQEFQADGTWKEIAKGSRKEGGNVHVAAPVTPVTIQDPKDPNKTIVVDGRTGRVIGSGPKLTETGKAEFKRGFNMQGIGASIQSAEDILSGVVRREDGSVDPTKKATTPTGSGVGAVVDTVGGFFGANPAGSVEAQKLKAVSGALISKMPRMEGPQSDKDVALYKEMAGMVGDPSVPRERRKSALEEVKRLWSKYERLNPDAFAAHPAAGGDGWSVVR